MLDLEFSFEMIKKLQGILFADDFVQIKGETTKAY